MPELPEVETIRLQLSRYLIGHKIIRVEVRYSKKLEGDPNFLIGGRIVNIRRFGKVQSIDLDNGYSILIHIKLTGQLIYRGPNLKSNIKISQKVIGGLGGKHTHIIFHLDNNGELFYNDVRKFGWIHIIKTLDVEKHKFIEKLGPEPLNDLSLNRFIEIIKKSSRPIKILLMDQREIAGVGNIYANDALWYARIDPKKKSNALSIEEAEKLVDAINTVLKKGLKFGGASELAYVTPDGSEGKYQNYTLVYGHENEICNHCHKAKIQKYFLGGRGTYICPICQK